MRLFPFADQHPLCDEGRILFAPGYSPYGFDLSEPPADLNGDFRVDELDGVEVAIDGQPLTEDWMIEWGRLFLFNFVAEPKLVRGSRVDVRYPVRCP